MTSNICSVNSQINVLRISIEFRLDRDITQFGIEYSKDDEDGDLYHMFSSAKIQSEENKKELRIKLNNILDAYFNENDFKNFSKISGEILGTSFLSNSK